MQQIAPPGTRDAELDAARAVLARCGADAELDLLVRAVQDALGYVPPPLVPLLAEHAGVERTAIFELVSTDERLSFAPPGRHRVAICLGEHCSRRGAAALADGAKRTLSLDFFQATANRAVRLEPFYCFGRCPRGPNVRIDGEVHERMSERRLAQLLGDLLAAG